MAFTLQPVDQEWSGGTGCWSCCLLTTEIQQQELHVLGCCRYPPSFPPGCSSAVPLTFSVSEGQNQTSKGALEPRDNLLGQIHEKWCCMPEGGDEAELQTCQA